MTLQAEEFIRRFLLHVLPEGFQRIRYYGFLARNRIGKLAGSARTEESFLSNCRKRN
jgi:Putative transposase